ncbi:ABC transporter permease [Bacteroidota bacterium]
MKKKNRKPPVIALSLLKLFASDEKNYALMGDFKEEFHEILEDRGIFCARLWYWIQTIKSLPKLITDSIIWGSLMLSNYFKIAWRNIRKQKGYSFINIFGLAVGIASCIIIMLFVFDELSYDKFYPNSDRTYRLAVRTLLNNNSEHTARSAAPVGPIVKSEFPEVEAMTRVRNYGFPVFYYKDKVFSEERVFRVDSTFFDIFHVKFIKGDAKSALNKTGCIVLTESMAKKYFGSEDPMGKILNSDKRTDYLITGIIEDVPANSHFHFDFLQPLMGSGGVDNPIWVFNDFYTYIRLREGASITELETKLIETAKKYMDPQIRRFMGIGIEDFLAAGNEFAYTFTPITDIHLHSNLEFEIEPNSDYKYIYIFSTIAFAILLIAVMNFVNLSTARSTMRAKEVGIRKTIGSQKRQLISQFLFESIMMSLIAMFLSIMLIYLFLPYFNDLALKNLELSLFSNYLMIPVFILLSIGIGFAAGSYPAMILSSFNPAVVLKPSGSRGGSKSFMRSVLVVFQFAISIVLIAGTLVIINQLSFIQNSNLGFNKDQVIVVKKTDDLGSQLGSFKQDLLQNQSIISVTNTSELLGNTFEIAGLTKEGAPDEEAQLLVYITTDSDFLKTYGIKLTAGRYFEYDGLPALDKIVINKSAAQKFGFDNPIGKILENTLNRENKFEIIGVVNDFHFESFNQQIKPMFFIPYLSGQYGKYVSVRIKPDNVRTALAHVKKAWEKFAGNQALEYEFFDEQFEKVYLSEQRTAQVFGTFSMLGIIIACLGLLGLATFITSQRTKEIGI